MRHFVGAQAGCIVTSYFVCACAERGGAIELADDDVVVGGKTSFEVRTDRCDEDHEQVFVGGMNTDLGACSDEQGADVERGAALVGRDETLVEFNDFLGHFHKKFCRHFGHENAAAGAL